MSKFNTSAVVTPTKAKHTPDTVNRAGGQAFAQSDELALASLATTNMVQDQYYRTADQTLDELRALIRKVDPYFAAQTAVYVRHEDGLRSITHAMAAEIAHSVKGEEWAKDFYRAVVRRPDDITEILSYYIGRYGKPLPNSLKKGLGAAFGKFDAYQLAKYRGEGNALSLVDAVNLVHPKPSAKNANALKQLVEGTLRSTQTWEAKVSAAGPDKEKKEEAWAEMVISGKIGYMALLKNLRNIVETGNKTLIDHAAKLLVDKDQIHKSLVLPFRFVVASRQISNAKITRALSEALEISLDNMPDLGESVLIAIDHSGSMTSNVAGNPDFQCSELGDIFAAALYKKTGADVLVFGDHAGPVRGKLNPADSVLTIATQIGNTSYGYGTNFHAIFESAKNKKYDSVVIFSDMQAWITNPYGYGRSTNVPTIPSNIQDIFAFDLAGYGSGQVSQTTPGLHQFSGYSDKSIALMGELKRDPAILVSKIKEVTFS